jgi:hypothetical protein
MCLAFRRMLLRIFRPRRVFFPHRSA